MRTQLYIIGPKKGAVKIGFSACPELRLKELQTANASKLEVLATKPGGEEEEAAAHSFLCPYRMEGEWFYRSHEVTRFVELLVAGLSVPLALTRLRHERAKIADEFAQQFAAKMRARKIFAKGTPS